jgi:hypothetical protein
MIHINHYPHLDKLRADIDRAQVAARYARSCALDLERGTNTEPHTAPHDYTRLAMDLERHVLTAPPGSIHRDMHIYDLAGLLRILDNDILTPRGMHSVSGAALYLSGDLLAEMEAG